MPEQTLRSSAVCFAIVRCMPWETDAAEALPIRIRESRIAPAACVPTAGRIMPIFAKSWSLWWKWRKNSLDFSLFGWYNVPVVNREEYSSGRRGVTRNLVGQGTGARVQIPSPPPNKNRNSDTNGLRFLCFYVILYLTLENRRSLWKKERYIL